MRKIESIWETSASGILIPAGTVAEVSTHATTTFLHVKTRAIAIEELYSNFGLKIPSACDLARLIRNAKLLSDNWLTNRLDKNDMMDVFLALQLERIAKALLPLRNIAGLKNTLRGCAPVALTSLIVTARMPRICSGNWRSAQHWQKKSLQFNFLSRRT